MNKIKLTICAEAAYAEKLSLYIREHEAAGIRVTWCTSRQTLMEQRDNMDVLLLGEAFQEDIREIAALAGEALVVLLTEDSILKECQGYPAIAKYQSAAEIVRGIYRCAAQLHDEKAGWAKPKEHLGIYAPWSYELSMIFGITLAQLLAADNSLLYISLQEGLGMEQLTGEQTEAGLEELISHLRLGGSGTGARIRSLCYPIGKAEYIAPVKNPQNINEVTAGDYQQLFNAIETQTEHQQTLWEFGPVWPGLFGRMEDCSQIYCPYQDEILHQARQRQLEHILQLHGQSELWQKLQFVKLPLIDWQTGASPDVSQLLYGAFADTIRKQVIGYRL